MLFYPMFEDRFQKVSNLIMEFAILYIFGTTYLFQNTESFNDEGKFSVLLVLFSSQMILMVMTISKSIKEILIDYKTKKANRNKRLPNTSVITDKNISRISLDQEKGFDKFVKDKAKEDPDFKIGLKEEVKVQKSSDGVVSPMRYISEFEEMSEEKDINAKIAAVHKKFFKKANEHREAKKSKLSKLLHKMKKKKETLTKMSSSFQKKHTLNSHKTVEPKKPDSSSSEDPQPVKRVANTDKSQQEANSNITNTFRAPENPLTDSIDGNQASQKPKESLPSSDNTSNLDQISVFQSPPLKSPEEEVKKQ